MAFIPVTTYALGIQVLIGGQTVTLVDVPNSAWFATYVRSSAEAGIVSGYKNQQGELTGKFGPSNNITIAEALKIAVEGAGFDAESYGRVIDSGVQHWSAPYVATAKAEHFAVIDARTRLDSPATRAEVAAIFTSAFGVNVSSVMESEYNDVETSTEYAQSIDALTRDEVVSGDTNVSGNAVGTFRPYDYINRAEVAKMVITARTAYGTPGEGRLPNDAAIEEGTVLYTESGFSPQVLHIKQGESVTFKNETTGDMWVASNPHPTHTDLSSFDAQKGMGQGRTYIYTFNKIGTWGYHNHANAQHTGTIVVEE